MSAGGPVDRSSGSRHLKRVKPFEETAHAMRRAAAALALPLLRANRGAWSNLHFQLTQQQRTALAITSSTLMRSIL